jgi:hypothetical protein
MSAAIYSDLDRLVDDGLLERVAVPAGKRWSRYKPTRVTFREGERILEQAQQENLLDAARELFAVKQGVSRMGFNELLERVYIEPSALTLEQAKVPTLKVPRDTIETSVEGIGGDVQMGAVQRKRSRAPTGRRHARPGRHRRAVGDSVRRASARPRRLPVGKRDSRSRRTSSGLTAAATLIASSARPVVTPLCAAPRAAAYSSPSPRDPRRTLASIVAAPRSCAAARRW